MNRLLACLLVVVASCDDGDDGKSDAGRDGGDAGGLTTDSSADALDVVADVSEEEFGVITLPDAGDAGDAVREGGAADASRNAPNSWWTLAGGTILAIQPVGGVLGSHIVVAGGRSSSPDTGLRLTHYFRIPDPGETTIAVSTGNPLNSARWGAAHAVAAGRLWAIGGSSGSGIACQRTTESLDSPTGQWVMGPLLPQARCGATATAVGQYIFLTGGTTAPVPDNPVTLASPATCRLDTMNVALGWDCTSFASGAGAASVRRFNAAIVASSAMAVVVGGRDMTNALTAVEQLVQMAGTPAFSAGAPLPVASNLPAAASANAFFYVLGGSPGIDAEGQGSANFWRAPNTSAAAWSPVTPAIGSASPRSGHLLLSARCPSCQADKLYVIGGQNGSLAVPDIEEYTE